MQGTVFMGLRMEFLDSFRMEEADTMEDNYNVLDGEELSHVFKL